MRCEEIMKRDPECLTERDTAQDAARRMKQQNIGFLPVCDDQSRPIGAVTDRDLAIRVLADGKNGSTPITDCMTREVVSCKASDDITRAEQLMGDRHKSRMLVVNDSGKLLGVISLSDIAERDQANAAKTLRKVSEREVRA